MEVTNVSMEDLVDLDMLFLTIDSTTGFEYPLKIWGVAEDRAPEDLERSSTLSSGEEPSAKGMIL